MTAWLFVTLRAPLASFGERSGNVERSSADRPTRSALIGLAGAALGIRRADADGQRALASGFRVATATIMAGSLMSDFHTYQSLPSAKGAPRTRAEALRQRSDLATSITRREYRSDVWFEAAYAANSDARWTLEDLRAAFRAPRFVLFLGRKSCPLSAPLDPEILSGDDVGTLFFTRLAHSKWLDPNGPLADHRARASRIGTIASERAEDLPAGNRRRRVHRRRDDPGDRLAWQFSDRAEFVQPGNGGEEERT